MNTSPIRKAIEEAVLAGDLTQLGNAVLRVADLLDNHQLLLSILCDEIIPERCEPLEDVIGAILEEHKGAWDQLATGTASDPKPVDISDEESDHHIGTLAEVAEMDEPGEADIPRLEHPHCEKHGLPQPCSICGLQQAEAEIERLRAANGEWQDRSLTAQTRVGELQPEVNRLSEALREERQKRDQARRERDTATERESVYGEALFEARNKIKTLMQQRDEYDAYCEDWAKDAEEGDAAYYRMQAERDEATAQLAALVEAVKPPRGGCALCAIEIGPDGAWAHDPHCILAGLAVAVQAHNAAQQAIGRASTYEGWQPIPNAVNALPEPLRRYIHDLETRYDPAGDVAALTLLRDQVSQLQIHATEQEVKGYEQALEIIPEGTSSHDEVQAMTDPEADNSGHIEGD